MKKADLLAKIAILLKATDVIPDDAELGFIFISEHPNFPTQIRSEFLPEGKVEKSWQLKGQEVAETVDAYGCEFKRVVAVEMALP